MNGFTTLALAPIFLAGSGGVTAEKGDSSSAPLRLLQTIPLPGVVYVTGGEGFVDVLDTKMGGEYTRIARIPTRAGVCTSLWVPELGRIYVAAPNRDGHDAAILILEAGASEK